MAVKAQARHAVRVKLLESPFVWRASSWVAVLKTLCQTGFQALWRSSLDWIRRLAIFSAWRCLPCCLAQVGFLTQNGAKTFDEMCDRIVERMSHENEYTYCYWDAFDSLLHKKGVDCEEAIQMLKDIDKSIENLCSKLEEGQTLIVLADHGQIDTDCVNILEYKDCS